MSQLSKALIRKYIFGLQVNFQRIHAKFVCEGHRVKVMVTGAKKPEMWSRYPRLTWQHDCNRSDGKSISITLYDASRMRPGGTGAQRCMPTCGVRTLNTAVRQRVCGLHIFRSVWRPCNGRACILFADGSPCNLAI